jgi:hypothetical protein
LQWRECKSNEGELMINGCGTLGFKGCQVHIINHEHLLLLNLISCWVSKGDFQSDIINHEHLYIPFVFCSSRLMTFDIICWPLLLELTVGSKLLFCVHIILISKTVWEQPRSLLLISVKLLLCYLWLPDKRESGVKRIGS